MRGRCARSGVTSRAFPGRLATRREHDLRARVPRVRRGARAAALTATGRRLRSLSENAI